MPLFYAITMFVSATLLFLVQPMVGRMVLPLLGGTPGVWNTCMVFYQMLLLLGYLYAHVVTTRFSPRSQVTIHLMVLMIPLVAMTVAAIMGYRHLPIAVLPSLSPQGVDYPVFGVLGLLAVAIALPFFAVSTSAPLLQKWFAETGHPSAKDPYFLYGASNFGSLLALLAYPIIVETTLATALQTWLWYALYAGLVAMVFVCGRMLWQSLDNMPTTPPTTLPVTPTKTVPVPTDRMELAPTWLTRLYWLGLAFVPSSLMLGVTTHITTDIASLPLLWVIPLALYLITFIIAFSRLPAWFMMGITLITPVLVLLLIFMMQSGTEPRFSVQLLLHLGTFFAVALVCHGELARNRPSTTYLTEFYLWMSVGGMFGGLFNAMLAPVVFDMILEYRITLVIACLFLPKLVQDSQDKYPRVYNLITIALFGLIAYGLMQWIGFVDSNEQVREMRTWMVENVSTTLMILLDWFAVLLPVIIWGGGLLVIYKLLHKPDDKKPSYWVTLGLDLLLPLIVLGTSRWLIGWENQFENSEALKAISKSTGLASTMLLKVMVYGLPAMVCYFFVERPVRFGLSVAALVLSLQASDFNSYANITQHRERSFFGVLKVDVYPTQNRLVHGTTLHGTQWRNHNEICVASALLPLGVTANPLEVINIFAAELECERLGREPWKYPGRDPLTYYHRTGPVGSMMRESERRYPNGHIGVVGLGTGSMSCYAKPGQKMTFYEIDASVLRIVDRELDDPKAYFTYLAAARNQGAKLDFIMGDARLKLEEVNAKGTDEKYSILLVDAFSSDAIPVHLLTREALQVFFDRVDEDGIVALHISNRHLDLEPVVAAIAKENGYSALIMNDGESDDYPGKTASSWIVLARNDKALGNLLTQPDSPWKPLTPRFYVTAWTDDFSNLLSILRFKEVKFFRRMFGMIDQDEIEE